jgi:hypothetical protein
MARVPAVTLLAALLAWAPAARASALPADFFGVVPQAPLSPADYSRMGEAVGTLRIPIYWFQVEPRAGEYRFADLDETIASAAAAGIRVLPFVYGTPPWLGSDPVRPPLGSASAQRAWTGFLRRLVGRYGPRGVFWQGRATRMPVHRWQIWNEPNFVLFWHPWPSPAGYARLLKLSAQAIRGEDPGATVVAAGVAPVEGGMWPWAFLRKLYAIHGVRRSFDVAAVHPYASSVSTVAEEIRLVRRTMSAAGDGHTPLLVTEIGVASSGAYPNPFNKGPRGQASYLRRVFQLLIAKRHRWRLAGVDWFTWRDGTGPDPHCVFCEFAGLFDASGKPKPAWDAFRRLSGHP